jgi:hypothetical protein
MSIKLSKKDEAYVQQLNFGTVTPVELTGDPSCDRFINAMNRMGAEAWENNLKNATREAIAEERAGRCVPLITRKIDQATF